jgi:hypothetical protein
LEFLWSLDLGAWSFFHPGAQNQNKFALFQGYAFATALLNFVSYVIPFNNNPNRFIPRFYYHRDLMHDCSRWHCRLEWGRY